MRKRAEKGREEGRGGGGGGMRVGKRKDTKKRGIGADTLFDLARKGRYLNQKLVGM